MASSPCANFYEIVSTNASLNWRSKNQRHVLNQIINCWRKDYLLSLREVRGAKQAGSGHVVQVGDVVILKDESVKRAFWKFAKVVQLLEGSDKIAWAALINVSTGSGPPKILKRSTRHLIPIEVGCSEGNPDVSPAVDTNTISEDTSTDHVNDSIDSVAIQPGNSSRPRRQAAISGDQTRTIWTGQW